MDIKTFISPPTIRKNVQEERKATWTELFYDLAFVALIVVHSHELAVDFNLRGVISFLIIFTGLWWSWVGNTFYNDRFDTDDIIHRLLVYLQMVAIVFVAVFVHNPFGQNFVPFILSFTAIRLLIIQANFVAGYTNKAARKVTYTYAIGSSIGVIPFLIAIFFDSEIARMILVSIGLAISMLTPFFLSTKKRGVVPLNLHYLSERFGLFTMLILGETIVVSVRSGTYMPFSMPSMYLIASSVFTAFIFWWLYFEKLNGSVFKKGNTRYGQIWVYTHLFLMMGLVFMALGLENTITNDFVVKEILFFSNTSLLNIAWFFVFICFSIIVHVTTYKGNKKKYESIQTKMYIMAALCSLGLLFLNIHQNPVLNLSLLNMLGASLVALDVYIQKKCRYGWNDPLLP